MAVQGNAKDFCNHEDEVINGLSVLKETLMGKSVWGSRQIYGLKRLTDEERSFCDLAVVFGNGKTASSHHCHITSMQVQGFSWKVGN